MPADIPTTTTRQPGLFSRGYLWITLGSCALVFLGAFESLAVTTVMPVVSADLNGASLYALAFAGPFATAVIGMVVAGNWSDRSGPVAPLYTSSALFALGLLIAGTATVMPVLLAGRLVQGLGTGAVTVALYVVIARIYPPRLHASIFAGFAAAWVIPSLIGPVIAGLVTEWFSWHWVFLGVVGLVVLATIMVGPAMRRVSSTNAEGPKAPWAVGRILWSVVAAVAVLALNLVATVPLIGGWLSLAAVVFALVALRPLVPRGTLTARRRLPSVVLLRGLAAASFFGAEVYLPYLLIAEYDFSPSLAGLALTLGALAWAATSWLQGRMGDALSNRAATVIGTVLVLAAILLAFATALFGWSPSVVIAGWLLGGGGMGLMYPRISVMTLAMSTAQNQGFNSAAMSISDSLGSALSLATIGLVFAAFGFPGVFAFAAVIAALAIVVAPRVAD